MQAGSNNVSVVKLRSRAPDFLSVNCPHAAVANYRRLYLYRRRFNGAIFRRGALLSRRAAAASPASRSRVLASRVVVHVDAGFRISPLADFVKDTEGTRVGLPYVFIVRSVSIVSAVRGALGSQSCYVLLSSPVNCTRSESQAIPLVFF